MNICAKIYKSRGLMTRPLNYQVNRSSFPWRLAWQHLNSYSIYDIRGQCISLLFFYILLVSKGKSPQFCVSIRWTMCFSKAQTTIVESMPFCLIALCKYKMPIRIESNSELKFIQHESLFSCFICPTGSRNLSYTHGRSKILGNINLEKNYYKW